MMTPNPLPEPGWWLVMPDGSQYECIPPEPVRGQPVPLCCDEEGAYYVSVDSGEAIWTPWADVDSVHADPDAAQLRADALMDEWEAKHGPSRPAPDYEPFPLDREARYAVTIHHRQGGDPLTPAMLRALGEVIGAAMSAAGIRATVAVEPAE